MVLDAINTYSVDDPNPGLVDNHITDSEVESFQKSIKEAAQGNHGEGSLYYDALTMSPLNSISAVSLNSVLFFFVLLPAHTPG